MNTNFGPVMDALLTHLQAATALSLTASATSGSAVLTGIASTAGLFAGLPVFGPGVVKGATIATVGLSTVTLSDAVTAPTTSGAFAAGFQSWSRRLVHWSQCGSQPAGFLRRVGTHDAYDHDSVWSITTLECEVWIYCDAGQNPDLAADVALNSLEQLVRSAFAPDDDERFTIGRLVHWCRFEGRGDSSPGDQGGQAISRLPVRITLP